MSLDAHYLSRTIAGRYFIERLLGQGSFAWVFHAVCPDGREVAIKILRELEPSSIARFAREIKVLKALPKDPHIAGYIDCGVDENERPFLVIEYVDGITLEEGLVVCPVLAPREAVAFVAELCKAFTGLHQLGVAHRDIKPENILLDREGGIKLIDFGLIRDAQGLLKLFEDEDVLDGKDFVDELDDRLIIGTPDYLAPEQFFDSSVENLSFSQTDTWSDVYSLGIILFQLITGEKLFRMKKVAPEEYHEELLRYRAYRLRLRDHEIPRCIGIDPSLDSILYKALRRDPKQRQADARELGQELYRYLQTGMGTGSNDFSTTVEVPINDVVSPEQAELLLESDNRSSEPHENDKKHTDQKVKKHGNRSSAKTTTGVFFAPREDIETQIEKSQQFPDEQVADVKDYPDESVPITTIETQNKMAEDDKYNQWTETDRVELGEFPEIAELRHDLQDSFETEQMSQEDEDKLKALVEAENAKEKSEETEQEEQTKITEDQTKIKELDVEETQEMEMKIMSKRVDTNAMLSKDELKAYRKRLRTYRDIRVEFDIDKEKKKS